MENWRKRKSWWESRGREKQKSWRTNLNKIMVRKFTALHNASSSCNRGFQTASEVLARQQQQQRRVVTSNRLVVAPSSSNNMEARPSSSLSRRQLQSRGRSTSQQPVRRRTGASTSQQQTSQRKPVLQIVRSPPSKKRGRGSPSSSRGHSPSFTVVDQRLMAPPLHVGREGTNLQQIPGMNSLLLDSNREVASQQAVVAHDNKRRRTSSSSCSDDAAPSSSRISGIVSSGNIRSSGEQRLQVQVPIVANATTTTPIQDPRLAHSTIQDRLHAEDLLHFEQEEKLSSRSHTSDPIVLVEKQSTTSLPSGDVALMNETEFAAWAAKLFDFYGTKEEFFTSNFFFGDDDDSDVLFGDGGGAQQDQPRADAPLASTTRQLHEEDPREDIPMGQYTQPTQLNNDEHSGDSISEDELSALISGGNQVAQQHNNHEEEEEEDEISSFEEQENDASIALSPSQQNILHRPGGATTHQQHQQSPSSLLPGVHPIALTLFRQTQAAIEKEKRRLQNSRLPKVLQEVHAMLETDLAQMKVGEQIEKCLSLIAPCLASLQKHTDYQRGFYLEKFSTPDSALTPKQLGWRQQSLQPTVQKWIKTNYPLLIRTVSLA